MSRAPMPSIKSLNIFEAGRALFVFRYECVALILDKPDVALNLIRKFPSNAILDMCDRSVTLPILSKRNRLRHLAELSP